MKIHVYINGEKCQLLHIAETLVDDIRYVVVLGRTNSGTVISMVSPTHSDSNFRIKEWKDEEEACVNNILKDYFEHCEV